MVMGTRLSVLSAIRHGTNKCKVRITRIPKPNKSPPTFTGFPKMPKKVARLNREKPSRFPTVPHGFPRLAIRFPTVSPTVSPDHHGQKHFIGTKTSIAENRELALVAGIMANGPPKPPGAQHQPANTAEQTMEYWLATGTKRNAHHANRPPGRAHDSRGRQEPQSHPEPSAAI